MRATLVIATIILFSGLAFLIWLLRKPKSIRPQKKTPHCKNINPLNSDHHLIPAVQSLPQLSIDIPNAPNLKDFNWRQWKSFVSFIREFSRPRNIQTLAQSPYWQDRLHGKTSLSIEGLIENGVLVHPPLDVWLSRACVVTDLHKLLGERGLKKTGSKSTLITRLIEADPVGALRIAERIPLYQQSETARDFIEKILNSEQEITANLLNSDYSKEQYAVIAIAISSGRHAMRQHGISVDFFLDAFRKAGGIQAPGYNLDIDTQRIIGSHALMSIGGTASYMGEPDWMKTIICREMNRAHRESYMAGSADVPNIAAFRWLIYDNVEDRDCCIKFASADRYNLGPYLFPKNAVAIPPPCCDRMGIEIVFTDEMPLKNS